MSQHRTGASRRSTRPTCEGLESRALLSVTAPPAPLECSRLPVPPHYRSTAPLLPSLTQVPQITASTQGPSGDANPYGVAFVPVGFARGGVLHPGDVLVSNYNGPSNFQGTGTSIVRITPKGEASLFARTPAGTGLSTALGILGDRFIVVGNLASADGTAATAKPGSLIVLDGSGKVVGQFSDQRLVGSPWDLIITRGGSHPKIFVSNAATGTVTRIDTTITDHGKRLVFNGGTQIASGYAHRPDSAAFLLGPTGLAYDGRHDTLYVASTLDNAVYAVKNAARTHRDGGTGSVIYADQAHLHGPLGLAFAPNGDLIAANGDAVNADPNQSSELVEFTRRGRFVGQLPVNTSAGAAFGLAVSGTRKGARLAAVDDVLNQLDFFTVGRS